MYSTGRLVRALPKFLPQKSVSQTKYLSDHAPGKTDFPFDKPLLEWKPLEKAEEENVFKYRLRLAGDFVVLGGTGLLLFKMGYRFLYGPPEL